MTELKTTDFISIMQNIAKQIKTKNPLRAQWLLDLSNPADTCIIDNYLYLMTKEGRCFAVEATYVDGGYSLQYFPMSRNDFVSKTAPIKEIQARMLEILGEHKASLRNKD